MMKTTIDGYPVITNAAMTGNITSLVTSIKKTDNISYQYNVAGSPVGSISVQVSSDYSQDANGTVVNAGVWNTVPVGTAAVSGAGGGIIELTQMPESWIRTVYTFTSGTGTLNVFINTKSGL
jgi:hypothetical protein